MIPTSTYIPDDVQQLGGNDDPQELIDNSDLF